MTRKQAVEALKQRKELVFTIRDRFAMAALQGMLASYPLVDRTTVNKGVWSAVAYEFADAMIVERRLRAAAGTIRTRGQAASRLRMKAGKGRR
jgi:hypothetical protein